MNKVFCLMLVLLSFAGAFAQEKAINESEFTAVFDKAKEKRESSPHRMKTTFQNTVEGKPEATNTGTVVIEFAPPSMSRIVLQTNSKSQTTERERIKVKDKVFIRENKSSWKEEKSTEPQSENRTSESTTKAEYKFLGTEAVGNQSASIYQKTESRKRISQKDNKEILADITTKYWFGDSGDLLKVERNATVRIGDQILHNSLTRTYEFDPNIKIETPQIANSGKQ